jgi:hypothetical protein
MWFTLIQCGRCRKILWQKNPLGTVMNAPAVTRLLRPLAPHSGGTILGNSGAQGEQFSTILIDRWPDNDRFAHETSSHVYDLEPRPTLGSYSIPPFCAIARRSGPSLTLCL